MTTTPTTLYLVRHAATAANLARPALLQGCGLNPPLAAVGVRQAELTRDFLAVRTIEACYCSPLRRAAETAAIIAEPHRLEPVVIDELTECDIGRWEGQSWDDVRRAEPEAFAAFHADPSRFAYPGGESFADVHARAAAALDGLLANHAGQTVLVVSHHVVNRTYLAGLLGLPLSRAKQVSLDNCGISVVVRSGNATQVATVNAAFHLQGAAA